MARRNWKTLTAGNGLSHISCMQLCREAYSPQVYVFVHWTITHQASPALHVRVAVWPAFALVWLLQDNKPENWDSSREKGERESDSDTLSTCESTTTGLLWSRSSWLTAVGEEFVGRGSAHWERGMRERRMRNLGCVSSCVYQKSLMRPFSLSLSPAWSSVCLVILVNEHSCHEKCLRYRHTVHTCRNMHTHAHTLIHTGYDSNLVWSIEILFVVPQCDPRWSSVILLYHSCG